MFKILLKPKTRRDCFPPDIWAVGWILLQILSRYKIQLLQYLHKSDDKKKLANSSQQELWTNYLLLSGPLSTDPEVLSVIDLAMVLLREDPAERLTTKQALAHPFLFFFRASPSIMGRWDAAAVAAVWRRSKRHF